MTEKYNRKWRSIIVEFVPPVKLEIENKLKPTDSESIVCHRLYGIDIYMLDLFERSYITIRLVKNDSRNIGNLVRETILIIDLCFL